MTTLPGVLADLNPNDGLTFSFAIVMISIPSSFFWRDLAIVAVAALALFFAINS